MIADLPCVIHGYIFLRMIGKGGFSCVYLVQSERYQMEFCAKVMQLNAQGEQGEFNAIESEVQALTALNHPHILRLYDSFADQTRFFLILELCRGGSLQTEVNASRGLSVERFRDVAVQLLSAVAYCHHKSIAHHDIKLGNILLDEYGRTKLCDFGIAVRVGSQGELCTQYCGSIQYESPEILMKKPHDPFRSDVWALGVLFAHMVNGASPWRRADTIGNLKKCIMTGNYELKRTCPQPVVEIIARMIQVDPKARITVQQIRKTPFFAEHAPAPTDSFRTYQDALSAAGREQMRRAHIRVDQSELPPAGTTLTRSTVPDEDDEAEPRTIERTKLFTICAWNMRNGFTGMPRLGQRCYGQVPHKSAVQVDP